MTKDEAWRIIKDAEDWNVGQKSLSYAFGGVRTAEDDMLDARRRALLMAWEILGESHE